MKQLATVLLCFISIITIAQTTIKIEGFGSILLPNGMEIQGGAYKEYVDKVKEINGVSASKVILQQKGLNDGSGGFDTYARVMIRTTFGDFNPITSPITQTDANEVNDIFESQTKNEAYSNNAEILTWNKAISTTLNGYKAVKFGYKRKIGNNPIVTVETYLIQNTDRMYSMTFESRNDSYGWSSIFLKSKNSIKISKN